MYEYSFYRIEPEFSGLGSLSLKSHREVIAKKAAEGWRYVDAIPAVQCSGYIEWFDLVFEREKKE